jgi:GH25 family lysozyme M1 (1,4-beta-N-acetylmuramidase)
LFIQNERLAVKGRAHRMKYNSGGILGKTGQTLSVELEIKTAAGPKPADMPDISNDPTKDAEFVQGTDVSSCQYPPNIKWDKVYASGVRFMYAQFGKKGEDKPGAEHVKRAKAAGVHVGAYQFATNVMDVNQKLDAFLKGIDGLPLDMPHMLDCEQEPVHWEGQTHKMMMEWIQKWLDKIESITKRRPVIYTGPGWWNQMAKGGSYDPGWAKYDLWLAQYADKADVPKPWTEWKFWQYRGNTIWQKKGSKESAFGAVCPGSDWYSIAKGGSISGMTGEVDMDKFNGNLAAFEAWRCGGAVAPAPQPKGQPSGPANGGNLSSGGGKEAPKQDPVTPPASARPDYPLLPEDLKARYLKMSFTLDGEPININLPHLIYQNLGTGQRIDMTLKQLVVNLVGEAQKDAALLEQLVPGPLGKGVPAFVMRTFSGKGSPEEHQAVLKVAGHFRNKLGSYWKNVGSLSDQVQAFYRAYIGLDCNGFAGNYARAVGGTKLQPETPIPQFSPSSKRRRKLEEILPGDLVIWDPHHIATIQGRRPDGYFDIVESNDETEVEGLGNTVRELTETGGDSFKIQKVKADGTKGRTETVYVATIK